VYVTLASGIFLGSWLVISIIGQVPFSHFSRLRQYDLCGLIPNWSFFAPNPVAFDYHLLYRDELWDLTLTDWTEVSIVKERPWWCFLWNPKRRRKKALFDSCSMLLRLSTTLRKQGNMNPVALHRSVPYLMLLNYISHLEHLPARGTQFLVIRTFGPTSEPKPALVFMSQFHALDNLPHKPHDFIITSATSN
jgi:hypothetical protein